MAGQVVVLNGAPRSGKSSIAAALQELADEPWFNLGVDLMRRATPPALQPGVGLRPGEPNHPAAAAQPLLYAALYESVAAYARLGLNVVVDVGHHDDAIFADCKQRLSGLRVLFVGVRCPIDTNVKRRRETGFPDDPALAQRWEEAVHNHVYELEVDTSQRTPRECAAAILAAI
ncbi:MAG TPA: hypothetical protein VFW85_09095 [Gaiellaceae bacterium]|nr:hypothetical protein [Gaiellaceae bacterium]